MSREFLLLLILYSLQFFVSIYSLSCVDESGKNVDFWFAIKFPFKKKTRFPKYFDGTRYAFYVAGRTDGWTFSNQTIRDAGSVFGRTLAPYYHKERTQLTWLFYSDQPPEGQCSSCFAHSKGVLMADSTSGFWLVHSVPKFPKATGNVISQILSDFQ
ncbi:ataxia telangiectasia and Rad3-related protein [Sarcoptes scabiei]|nr:ataxia telangiectasia and Rad3-related protein [Sarcoptes scabiei]